MSGAAGPARFPWPPVIYGAALVAGIVCGLVLPAPWIGPPLADLLFAIGWLALAGGAALAAFAVRALKRAGTAVAAHHAASHLVTSGPFGFSRNPIYLGMTTILVGLALIAGNPWLLAAAVLAAVATTHVAIRREEVHLAHRFGKAWRDYSKRVRRWI